MWQLINVALDIHVCNHSNRKSVRIPWCANIEERILEKEMKEGKDKWEKQVNGNERKKEDNKKTRKQKERSVRKKWKKERWEIKKR